MTGDEFNVVLERRLTKIRHVLAAKAGEYATAGDRLHNFKGCSEEFGGTPAENLWGMLKKHLMSVKDMVAGDKPVTAAMVNEKLGDAVNYLCLLEALFLEQIAERECGREV